MSHLVPLCKGGPYVIDGLMHNDVIKSDIHSTDTLLFIFQNMDTNKTSFLQAS